MKCFSSCDVIYKNSTWTKFVFCGILNIIEAIQNCFEASLLIRNAADLILPLRITSSLSRSGKCLETAAAPAW